MNESNIISWVDAKRLKDLGFNEPTWFAYNEDGILEKMESGIFGFKMYKSQEYSIGKILAPDVYQVLEWYLQEKRLCLYPNHTWFQNEMYKNEKGPLFVFGGISGKSYVGVCKMIINRTLHKMFTEPIINKDGTNTQQEI